MGKMTQLFTCVRQWLYCICVKDTQNGFKVFLFTHQSEFELNNESEPQFAFKLSKKKPWWQSRQSSER